MANTLTGLIPTLYEALDTVSREMVGFVPAVRRNTDVARAAKDQTVTFPIVPATATYDITPGQLPTDNGTQTVGNDTLTISKSKYAPTLWNGEEVLALNNADKPQYGNIVRDQFAQAFRVLGNEIDGDLAGLYADASNAYGVAGTAPFGTANDFNDFAGTRKLLEDNGTPTSALQMVLNSAAIANIRGKQSSLFKVNEAGGASLLRNGAVGSVEGFMIHNSAEVDSHTKGTGTSYTSSSIGFAVGATDIALISGSGTVLAGDVVSFAGNNTKYIVETGVSAPGTISIAKPGLKAPLAASAIAMTIGDGFDANMVFDKNAIVLATRVPAAPDGGDSADDVMLVTDPRTGITYEVRLYRQYRQVKIEIALAWGFKLVKPEHVGILLG